MIQCSTVAGVGTIDDEDSFDAAVNSVNGGVCNWIDIARDIAFATDFDSEHRSIYLVDVTSLLISGPREGATLSGKRGAGEGATFVRGLVVNTETRIDIEILNLNFEDFVATGFNTAGALAFTSDEPLSTVTIRNSRFSRNRAFSGGALVTDGTVEIFDSTFEDNTAYGVIGGAIAHGVDGPLTVDNVTFVDNTASGCTGCVSNGGAISSSSSVVVSDSLFHGNSAGSGGAIYVYTPDGQPMNSLEVTGSTFSSNEAIGTPGYGGAISTNEVEVRESSFVNNSASWGGGAIWVGSETDPTNVGAFSAEIVNSTFKVNTVTDGGALMIGEGSTGSSTISFSTVVQTSMLTDSGSLINAGSEVRLGLVGSVLVGKSPVCREFDTTSSLDLTANSSRSFVSDDSCGGSAGAATINASYSSASALGLSPTLSSDTGAGRQVFALADNSVLHSSVPLSLLPSGVTTDQLGLARFASNGLTAAGALRGDTYVAPPVVPEAVPEVPLVETVKPAVPAVATQIAMQDGRAVISGSSPDNIGRKVRVMVRLRGTNRFVPAGFKVVNKVGRFKWSPSSGKEAEMYFVVGGVASEPVKIPKIRKP